VEADPNRHTSRKFYVAQDLSEAAPLLPPDQANSGPRKAGPVHHRVVDPDGALNMARRKCFDSWLSTVYILGGIPNADVHDVDAGIKRQHFRRCCGQRKPANGQDAVPTLYKILNFRLGRRQSVALPSTCAKCSSPVWTELPWTPCSSCASRNVGGLAARILR
jgi:hypothetical protein